MEAAWEPKPYDWSCPGGWKDLKTYQQNTLNDGTFTPGNEIYKQFILEDFTQGPSKDAEVWDIGIQRGFSVPMFWSLAHHARLWDMGLRPDTAFGCAIDYLMRPTRFTLNLVKPDMLGVMTDESIIKIGIQVRTGDKAITDNITADRFPDKAYDRMVQPFFDCASQLETDIKRHFGQGTRVVYYLMTDNAGARAKAKLRFSQQPGKLLTFDDTAVEYYQSVTSHGYQKLVMEHWLLSQAHYHIITHASGLGRTAALMSLRATQIYTMAVPQNNFADRGPNTTRLPPGAGCTFTSHDSLNSIYDQWSGVRRV